MDGLAVLINDEPVFDEVATLAEINEELWSQDGQQTTSGCVWADECYRALVPHFRTEGEVVTSGGAHPLHGHENEGGISS